MRGILFAATGYGNVLLPKIVEAGHTIAGVFTAAADERFERAHGIASLAQEASARAIPAFENIDALKTTAAFEFIRACEPDFILVVNGYDRRVSLHVMTLAGEAWYLHPSLLPSYGGASPSNWAIIEGERETGVTLARLGRNNEAGEVLAQKRIPILSEDTDGSLRRKLGEGMWELLEARLRNSDESPEPLAAREYSDTNYPCISQRDAHVRFDQPRAKLIDRVRGVTPYPGAYTDIGDTVVVITSAAYAPESASSPGQIVHVEREDDRVIVACTDGTVSLAVEGAIPSGARFAGIKTPFSASALTVSAVATYDDEWPSQSDLFAYEWFPDMVVVAVAYPCNALCPNCPYTPGNSTIREKYGDAQFMAPELFMKIADECGEARQQRWLPSGLGAFVRITGGGEPMLHPYGMTKLIEYAMNAGARVYLNTNGSLFERNDIDRLLACNVDNIEISVDAADPQTYAIVRKGLDWEKLLAAVRYTIDRRNQTHSRTTIEVSVIGQEIVADRIEEIERFWYDFGVDNVIVRKFLTWGSATNIDPNLSADPLPYLDREIGVPCPYPFHRLNVDSRGKVEVCGFDIGGRTNFGNLGEQSIRDIWQGAQFRWWREKHARGEGGDIPLCSECPDWKYRSWKHNYRKALLAASEKRDHAQTVDMV